ncbi:MAG TPA: hypothetical protein VKZ70_07405 [Burkholderiaceae bacterium]|nr:hypothetical protein [Burkholderiaceae bacterium]
MSMVIQANRQSTLSPRRLQARDRQHGQVMVFGLLLAGAVATALVHYFEAGKVLAQKTRQDHVLDAAAYSGALVQARALNMLAYINRAQVAHQVAMAHLVALGSLAHFAGMEAQRASLSNPPAYVIAMHFGAEHAAAYLAALQASGLEYMAREQGPLAAAYARHDELNRSVLASAASQVANRFAESRDAAMQEVVRSNYSGDTEFRLDVVDDNAASYLSAYVGNRMLQPFIRGLAELYEFLEPRDYMRRSLFPVSARCPTLRHELRRRGSTVLSEQGVWQSTDTQSYHALRSNRWIGCYYREYPMGWGWIPPRESNLLDLEYVEDSPDNFAEQDFWRWVRESTRWDIANSGGNPLANSWAYRDKQRWEGGGLPVFHDLSSSGRASTAHFTVSLQRQGSDGLTLHSRSGAETYFRRPHDRMDGLRELSSTFHPYWHARLRKPSAEGEK